MPTYSLDSSPFLYVSCPASNNPNHLIYLRKFIDDGKTISLTEVAKLDPNKNDDVLTVYGTEFSGLALENLGHATRLRNSAGSIAVNCRCATIVGTNVWYKGEDDIIFDWARFGVVVPGTPAYGLQEQVKLKDVELKASQSMVDFIKGEYEECKKERREKDEALQKSRDQVSSLQSALRSAVAESEALQVQVKELKDELSKCKN